VNDTSLPSRRRFLGRLALGGAAFAVPTFFTVPGLFADQLTRTPPMTEGPFYPDRLPLDTDNDLLVINDSLTPAVGVVTHLTGRVLSPSGSPVRNALVEIWQCDARQVYHHSGDTSRNEQRMDRNFQGFGRFLTSSTGEYYFRTIRPVPYPGRPAPHIHFKIKQGGRELLTTQLFIAGHPGNLRDGIFRDLRDPIDRELVQVNFRPVPGSRTGEVSAHFDLVLGRTPDEGHRRRAGAGAVEARQVPTVRPSAGRGAGRGAGVGPVSGPSTRSPRTPTCS
jgi:protocatechuate 3,4-dioxygenase beta subunit